MEKCGTSLQTEARFKELTSLGVKVQIVAIGNKGKQYFKRRPKFNVVSECWLGCGSAGGGQPC
jgi:F0F1-type ATP synthase gamma subunit